MYHQKLLDGIKARTGREEESNRTRITLCPFTSIYSSEIVPATGSTTGEAVRLTLHGVLTRSVSHKTYDAVFCGTGYDRDAWMRLLAESDLAEPFGVKSSAITLVTDAEAAVASQATLPLFSDVEASIARAPASGDASSSSSDGFSTPPTPDTPHSHHAKLAGENGPSKVRVSRTYRILPAAGGDAEGAAPRVYLQGCTQATHGLSESLLSILGVRAGLVVDELCGSA